MDATPAVGELGLVLVGEEGFSVAFSNSFGIEAALTLT